MSFFKSVLVIDLDRELTRVIEAILMMNDYEATICNDPNEGLELISINHYDLILIDILMPGMVEIDFIKKAKNISARTDQHYAVLSSKKLNQKEQEEVFRLGIEVITKPFTPHVLIEKIGRILYKN